MRTHTSFAPLVPTASPDAVRLDRPARGTRALAVVALVAMLAGAGYAAGGNAHDRAGTGAAVATSIAPSVKPVDVAPADGPVTESWAADESRNGTRPDAAH